MKLGENIHPEIQEGIQHLPVHIARPLYELYNSNLYFKKLHLVSDILLGFFRLYGHALINFIENQGLLSEGLNQSIETLKSKDSHGLWSTTIAKILQEINISGKHTVSAELFSVFGISVQSSNTRSLKRLTVKNTIIDGRGKKQTIDVTNTPIELLINFRNKYVGHGTVYSEEESIHLFQVYEPVLRTFIESLNSINDFSFSGSTGELSVYGYDKASEGLINVVFNSINYVIDVQSQLKIEPYEENDFQQSTIFKKDDQDIRIIETYPYFIAYPYKRAIEETDGFKRLHLLKEVFLNYLKYLGLLTASEYFNSNLKIGDINRAFKNFLYRPQFGHWNAFMRSAIQAFNENNHNWFIKELAGYYERVETKPYAEFGETSIGKLIDFRNQYLGHSTVPTDKKLPFYGKKTFRF